MNVNKLQKASARGGGKVQQISDKLLKKNKLTNSDSPKSLACLENF